MSAKKHLVVALAYDGLCTFEFGCTVELFALDRPELGVDWYDFAVCAVEPGPIRAAGGIVVQAPYDPSLLERADTIVIPGWRDADEPPPEALLVQVVGHVVGRQRRVALGAEHRDHASAGDDGRQLLITGEDHRTAATMREA